MKEPSLERVHFVRRLITTSTFKDKQKVKTAIVDLPSCYETQESGVGFLTICARGESNVFGIFITCPFLPDPSYLFFTNTVLICLS
jgi:hypothetical protein